MAAKNEGKPTYGKPKTTKTPAKKPSGEGLYDWGPGGRTHSIPLAQHEANVQGVKNYGVRPDTPLDAPLTSETAYRMAQAAAAREYGPQTQAVQRLQQSVPDWYANAIARVGQAQQEQQAYSQPLLQQAQGWAQQAPSLPPGMDPNSPEAANALQASRSGQDLAQLGYSTLAAIPVASNTYLSGQQAVAARELPQLLAGYGQQLGQLGSAREQAATEEYGRIRTGEQNASIARETLGLNTVKAASDAASDAASLEQTARDKKAARVVSRKNTRDRVAAQGQRTVAADAERQRKADEKTAKEAEKKTAAIKKATGGIQNTVRNVVSQWEGYVGQQTDDTSKPKLPDGTYPPRNLTPPDIKRILGQKNDAGLVHVALLVRAGKPLDQAAIDYLHHKDPDIRIPREWLRGRQKPSNIARGTGNPASSQGTGLG